jgi:hypothetical protein
LGRASFGGREGEENTSCSKGGIFFFFFFFAIALKIQVSQFPPLKYCVLALKWCKKSFRRQRSLAATDNKNAALERRTQWQRKLVHSNVERGSKNRGPQRQTESFIFYKPKKHGIEVGVGGMTTCCDQFFERVTRIGVGIAHICESISCSLRPLHTTPSRLMPNHEKLS